MFLRSNIQKLYLSNFLTGLIFWYGIEKLFMQQIGITPIGIGVVSAIVVGVALLLDIPAGILADRWSRKYVLIISAISLAIGSLLMGLSHGVWLYALADVFYGIYVVSTSGTYHAITYDSLHELGRTDEYSKISGHAYAMFLVGAGVANILSGFIAYQIGLSSTYLISVVPCIMNIVLITTIVEPAFHKPEAKERILASLGRTATILKESDLLRSLVIILSTLAIVELYKSEFSQLYMLRYVSQAQLLGLLWAGYSFTWALGSLIAHRLHAHINLLMLATVVPLLIMGFVDNWIGIIFFMIQAVASAALINQIETRVQEVSPSSMRASILSVVATFGRALSVPASLIIGWISLHQGSFVTVRWIAVVAGLILLYWFMVGRGRLLKTPVLRPEAI